MLSWSRIHDTKQSAMSTIGQSLQRARRARQMTQADLSEQAGLSRMTVQRMEADQVDPKFSTVVDVARCVGLEVMVVPTSLREEIEYFIRAGGKYLGREPGIDAPKTAVQELRAKVLERLAQQNSPLRNDLRDADSLAMKDIDATSPGDGEDGSDDRPGDEQPLESPPFPPRTKRP
jgi:DNA-binding XRE family transcriptional regulator